MALKLIAILVAVILVVAGLYIVKLLLTEDLYVSKGTIAYYVTIRSTTIKDFPRLNVIGEENYYSSCGDGPKPPANGIRYTSSEDPLTLQRSIEEYLLKRGFAKTEESSTGGSYLQSSTRTSLELTITPENDAQRVVATEYYILD